MPISNEDITEFSARFRKTGVLSEILNNRDMTAVAFKIMPDMFVNLNSQRQVTVLSALTECHVTLNDASINQRDKTMTLANSI